MESFLQWLENLPLSAWVAQSESVLAFPMVLFLHNMGMGFVAGSAYIIGLRLLGVARPLPVSSLRIMFKIFWGGFALSVIFGSLLFAAAATSESRVPIFFVKMGLVVAGLSLAVPIRTFVDGADSDGVVPPRVKTLAAALVVAWTGVIVCGRLIAYLK